MESKKKKRPRDLSLLARSIVEEATGERLSSKAPAEEKKEDKPRTPMPRLSVVWGDLREGKLLLRNSPLKKEKDRARKAAQARWTKKNLK